MSYANRRRQPVTSSAIALKARRDAYKKSVYGQRMAALLAVRGPRSRQPIGGAMIAARARAAIMDKKGMDTDIGLSPVIATTNTNASSFTLNLIQQGAGSWNRVGRKAHLKSVRLVGNYIFTYTPTAATGAGVSTFCRMVLVWDKQPAAPTGAVPTFDAIFGITAQDGTESCPDITCPPRFDNMDRFRILRDELVPLQAPGFSGTGTAPSTADSVPFDYYVRLNNLETVFSGQTAPMTIADISSGALYVFFRALNNSAQATVGVDGIARLRYTD